MAHHEIQSLADLTTSPVALQHKLRPLKQQRRLRGVLLCGELVQTTIQIHGDTQIHSHERHGTKLVPSHPLLRRTLPAAQGGGCLYPTRSGPGVHLKLTIMAGSTATGVPSSHFKLFWLESSASFPIETILR